MMPRYELESESVYDIPAILVAEDDKDSRTGLCRLLKSIFKKTPVDWVEDGRLLVEQIQSHPNRYGLIISDFNMPLMNGADALKRVRAIDPSIISCIYTAVSHKEA